MKISDVVSLMFVALAGAAAGWAVGGTMGALVVSLVTGAFAYLGSLANMRPAVVSTVLIATIAGGFIGSRVVQAICLPQTCQGTEWVGGITVGILTLVGVGLLTALVARSFDEFREREEEGSV